MFASFKFIRDLKESRLARSRQTVSLPSKGSRLGPSSQTRGLFLRVSSALRVTMRYERVVRPSGALHREPWVEIIKSRFAKCGRWSDFYETPLLNFVHQFPNEKMRDAFSRSVPLITRRTDPRNRRDSSFSLTTGGDQLYRRNFSSETSNGLLPRFANWRSDQKTRNVERYIYAPCTYRHVLSSRLSDSTRSTRSLVLALLFRAYVRLRESIRKSYFSSLVALRV